MKAANIIDSVAGLAIVYMKDGSKTIGEISPIKDGGHFFQMFDGWDKTTILNIKDVSKIEEVSMADLPEATDEEIREINKNE